jgi:hypothetical protein
MRDNGEGIQETEIPPSYWHRHGEVEVYLVASSAAGHDDDHDDDDD